LDKPSFIELYDRYFDGVNRYLRYRVDDPWDADDLTATVFLKAWENFSKFRGKPLSLYGFSALPTTPMWITCVRKSRSPGRRSSPPISPARKWALRNSCSSLRRYRS